MQAQRDADTGRYTRTRAFKRFAPLLLDRDALERFLDRAVLLVPPGGVALELAVRDGAFAGTFASLRDLAADPDFSTRLRDVAISIVRTDAGTITHELQLRDLNGSATLLAFGAELWAYGALGVLSELLAVYGKPQRALQPASTETLAYFSCGFTVAIVVAAAALRGAPAAVAAALICGTLWFFSDMALSEIRVLLTPPAPKPLTIEIRSGREPSDSRPALMRVWLGLRLSMLPLWIAAAYLVLFFVLPRVPKHW